jgi:hypothetical protein
MSILTMRRLHAKLILDQQKIDRKLCPMVRPHRLRGFSTYASPAVRPSHFGLLTGSVSVAVRRKPASSAYSERVISNLLIKQCQ